MSICSFARYCQIAHAHTILYFRELLFEFLLFYILPILCIFSLLNLESFDRDEMLSIIVSVGISLTTSEFENLFICLLVIPEFTFCKFCSHFNFLICRLFFLIDMDFFICSEY